MVKACVIDQSGVLHVEGDMTFATANMLLGQSLPWLAKQRTPQVDLSAVGRIDSAGLALLCEWKRRYHTLQFHHLPDKIMGMITLSGLGAILPGKCR